MKPILCIWLWVGFMCSVSGQSLEPQVFSNAGYSNIGYQAWTIGEPLVDTYDPGGSEILTQGFHQPNLKAVGLPEPYQAFGVQVYPRPTSGIVYIDFQEPQAESVEVELIATTGQVLERRKFQLAPTQTSFDLSSYSAAIYFVRVFWQNRSRRQVFKIEKINY